MLPAVEQIFAINASAYLAGIDKMLAATDRLTAGIDAAIASSARMDAAMSAAGAGVTAAADEAAAAADLNTRAQTVMSDAEKAAADAAAFEAGLLADLAAGEKLLADSAKICTDAMAVEAKALKTVADSAVLAGDATAVAGDKSAVTAGKMDAAGGSAAAFGGHMKTALLGVGIAAIYGIDKAAKFQASMEQLHTQAGVAQSKLAGLSQGVLQLAAQTGEGPQSLAESLYHVASNMASLGTTGPKMMSAVKIAAEGAQVGGAGLVDVTNALTAAIASGIPGVNNFQQAMGMLNATVGSGDMHMQDLADAFSTGLLAVVKGYGISLKDTGAALAVFGDNNIRGAKAGTDFRMAVQALAVPAAAAKKELAGLGLTQASLAKDMQSGGLMKALDDLTGRFKANGVTAKNEGEVITTLFGKKAGSGIAVLLEQMDRLKSKYPAITDAANGFGNAWQARQKTMAQQWNDLKAGLQALAISFGTILLPAATKVVGVFARFAAVLEKNPELAAFAGGLLAVGIALKLVTATTAAFGLTLDAIPIFAVITAIAALVLGLYELYKHSKLVRDIVADVGKFFAGAWRLAVEAAGAVIKWFVSGPLAFIKQEIGVFAKWWSANGAEVMQVWKALWGYVRDIAVMYWRITWAVIKLGLDILKIEWKITWTILKDTLLLTWNVIKATVSAAIKVVLDIIAVVLDLITGHWSKAWSDIKKLVGDYLHGVANVIGAWASGAGKLLWDAGKAIVQGLINGVKAMLGAVGNVMGDVGHGLVGAFKSVTGIGSPSRVFYGFGGDLTAGLANGITDTAGRAVAAATALGQQVSAAFSAASASGQVLVSGVTATVAGARAHAAAAAAAAAAYGGYGGGGGYSAPTGTGTGTGSGVSARTAARSAAAAARALIAQQEARNFANLGAFITARIGSGIIETMPQAVTGARKLMQAIAREFARGEISSAQASSLALKIEEALTSRKDRLVKTMQEIGLKMQAGLLSSLEGAASASQAKAAVNKMIGYVREAWLAGDITNRRASNMTKWLEADSARLQAVATRRQSLLATIKAADAYAATTSQNAQQWAGLSSVAGNTTSGGMVYSGNLLAGMQANLAAIRQFGAAIKKLAKMGLRKDLLDQIVQMGPASGLQVALALIDGPAKVIAEMNATEKQIVSGSNALGQAAANAMFDSGKQAGKGFLSGLKAQEHAVTAMMDRAAVSMVKTMRRELGMGGHGGGAMIGNVTVNVPAGFVGSKAELAREIHDELRALILQYDRHNGKNGLSLNF